MQKKMVGKSSIRLAKPVYVEESTSVVGKKEGDGPLGSCFDLVYEDAYFGRQTWEEAESEIQKKAVEELLFKSQVDKSKIRYLLAGDLLGQNIASSFGVKDLKIPLFGLYGACSTCGESLGLGSLLIDGEFAEYLICVTSSHYASAEKEFRFPLEYGSQRPLSASWTVTGGGAFLLSREGRKKKGYPCQAAITEVTTGKIIDFGLKDSMNMGCCMAPAACDTIFQHLSDMNRRPSDYDRIITGDLGKVGQVALIDLLNEKGIDITSCHMDCGIEIFDGQTQDTHAGGSGCGCAASVLSAMILERIQLGEWKRVLFVPTGALLSKVSYNEGKSVPGIAHAIVIEAI